MSGEAYIEWLEHPTVRPENVGKKTRMGAGQAANQIAKGRAKLVEEEPVKPKRRSRARKEEAAEAEE